MKKIYFAFAALTLLLTIHGCEKDLPYPIDEVKRGVLIDVARIPGTDGVLGDGVTTGNYQLKMIIPENQGDYSFMKHAQLIAVLNTAQGAWKSAVAVDNITDFPKTIELNIGDVYSKLGLSTPSLGETLYFTANAILDNGETIYGWTETAGFNNTAFAGWIVDGRGYSSNARYSVACPWSQDPDNGSFIGTFICDEVTPYGNDSYEVTLSYNSDLPADADIPAGVTKENLYGVTISPFSPNIWMPAFEEITVWINSEDLTLVIPTQDTGDVYSNGMKIMWYNNRNASVSTCSRTIQFTTNPYIPGFGGWGAFTFTIHP